MARRIYDFYDHPPRVGQRMVMVDESDCGADWYWVALDENEPLPQMADPATLEIYDGHHARELEEIELKRSRTRLDQQMSSRPEPTPEASKVAMPMADALAEMRAKLDEMAE